MRLPWSSPTRSDEECQEAEHRVDQARSELRRLLNDLEEVVDRIEDKRRRGMPGDD